MTKCKWYFDFLCFPLDYMKVVLILGSYLVTIDQSIFFLILIGSLSLRPCLFGITAEVQAIFHYLFVSNLARFLISMNFLQHPPPPKKKKKFKKIEKCLNCQDS